MSASSFPRSIASSTSATPRLPDYRTNEVDSLIPLARQASFRTNLLGATNLTPISCDLNTQRQTPFPLPVASEGGPICGRKRSYAFHAIPSEGPPPSPLNLERGSSVASTSKRSPISSDGRMDDDKDLRLSKGAKEGVSALNLGCIANATHALGLGVINASCGAKKPFLPITESSADRKYWGIVQNAFARPEHCDVSFNSPAPMDRLTRAIAEKDLPTQQHLKAVLQAVLIDYPEMGRLHLLSIAAEAIRKITGIEPPRQWNQTYFDQVWKSLETIPSAFLEVDRPDLANSPRLFQQMLALIEIAPESQIAEFLKKLHAILTASPALTPSYMQMLATQSYHQIAPGLDYPHWTQEDPVVQIKKMFHLLRLACEESRLINILKERIGILSLKQKTQLKTALHAVFKDASLLTAEEKTQFASHAYWMAAMTPGPILSDVSVQHLYESLAAVSALVLNIEQAYSEEHESLKKSIREMVSSLPLEASRLIYTHLQAILCMAPFLKPQEMIELANRAFLHSQIAIPSWTLEDPTVQISRIMHFMNSCS